ncbi:sensor histidine kinase [Methylocystis heyeri]|nr:HAMP domain-containing sensor histidine kinase [Methylocystis heyeri]
MKSLTARTLLYWSLGTMIVLLTYPVVIVLPLMASGLADPANVRLQGAATRSARAILADAVRRAPDGSKYIETTDALRDYATENPKFRYAAFDPERDEFIAGSSPALVAEFKGQLKTIETLTSMFHLASDPDPDSRGGIRAGNTPAGVLTLIVYGAEFRWSDLYTVTMENWGPVVFAVYLALFGLSSVIVHLVVKRGLEPLRKCAASLSQVDLDTLDQRLPTDNLPSEVAPFVAAVNAALARVDAGVARQQRFLANSAHELRTPVAILRTRIEKLGQAPVEDVKRELKRDLQRVQTLLEQLLVLAQIEEQASKQKAPYVDLGEVVMQAVADYSPIAVSHGRQLSYEAPPSPVTVRAYPWAIESVVMNLIGNAVREEPPGGAVVVRINADASVEVIDHGAGVAKSDREMIFEPFWRKDERKPGTGLGLAIARELIGKLQGRIWVEETSGGGATFKVSLPASA